MQSRPQYRIAQQPKENAGPFERDMLELFCETRAGHTGLWEYGENLYNGDPAGGASFWADLVKNPGYYYPAEDEKSLIAYALRQQHVIRRLSNIHSVVELGPGSDAAITEKTIPFLLSCPNLNGYVAIDASPDQARHACQTIKQKMPVDTQAVECDFARSSPGTSQNGQTAFIMWGCTIGNLEGFAGEYPTIRLAARLSNLSRALRADDLIFLIFDTENEETKVIQSYSEPSLRAQSLSILYLLKRDGLVTGDFDPRVWCHEPVWFADVQQCAHTLYPLFPQTFHLAGRTIKIPAWRRLVANNSYKFRPETVIAAAHAAGLKAQTLQHGSMAMLIAQK